MSSARLDQESLSDEEPRKRAAQHRADNIRSGYIRLLTATQRVDLSSDERLGMAVELTKLGFLDDARAVLLGAEPSADLDLLSGFINRVDRGEEVLEQSKEGDQPETDGGAMIEGHHRRGGVLVAPCPGATRTVLMFAGNGDSRFPFSRTLAQIKDSHLIVLKDPARCFGLCEVPRLGRTYEENVDRLKRVMQSMGTKQVFCIGLSSGGFPALKFGLDLGASGVLNFSSPTSLDINDDPGADVSKYPQLALLYRKARHLGIDLAKVYRVSLPRPQVILVYGGAHSRDKLFAKHMEDITGVSLRPVKDFDGHTTYVEAIKRGFFEALLKRTLALTQIT